MVQASARRARRDIERPSSPPDLRHASTWSCAPRPGGRYARPRLTAALRSNARSCERAFASPAPAGLPPREVSLPRLSGRISGPFWARFPRCQPEGRRVKAGPALADGLGLEPVGLEEEHDPHRVRDRPGHQPARGAMTHPRAVRPVIDPTSQRSSSKAPPTCTSHARCPHNTGLEGRCHASPALPARKRTRARTSRTVTMPEQATRHPGGAQGAAGPRAPACPREASLP